MDKIDINTLFKESRLYKDFKDTVGNQLQINDFVRVDRLIHEGKYINQMFGKICFSFTSGIYVELVALYRDDFLNEVDKTENLVSSINQWTIDNKIYKPCPIDINKKPVIWSDTQYNWFKIYKIDKPISEFPKIELSFSYTAYLLRQINTEIAVKYWREELNDEEVEKAIELIKENIEYLDIANFK